MHVQIVNLNVSGLLSGDVESCLWKYSAFIRRLERSTSRERMLISSVIHFLRVGSARHVKGWQLILMKMKCLAIRAPKSTMDVYPIPQAIFNICPRAIRGNWDVMFCDWNCDLHCFAMVTNLSRPGKLPNKTPRQMKLLACNNNH